MSRDTASDTGELSDFERQVSQLHDIDASDLPDRTKAAVRLTDRLLSVDPVVDDALYTATREHFDDAQIADLGMLVTWASGWQRFIEAFGIRPDAWQEGDAPPWTERRPAVDHNDDATDSG